MKHILTIVLPFLLAAPLMADNWPTWRGPRHDGTATATGVPTEWKEGHNIAWRTPLPGKAGATPCVWEERIFLTSNDGDDLVVMALSTQDGAVLWKRTVGSGNQDARAGEGNSASPSPSTDGVHVWTFFGTGILACHTVDGDEVWKCDVGERFGRIDIQFGMTSTPVLDGDALYLQLIHGPMKLDDQTRTGKVVKLDKTTGKTIWEVERTTDAQFECKHSYASPGIYRDGDREFLVVHGADCTTGHALGDGRELWRFGHLNGPTGTNPKPHDPTFRFVASPGIVPGLIVVPTAKGGPTVALHVSDSLAGDCSEKQEVIGWVQPRTPDVSTPLINDGLVWLLHNDGKLQCLDAATGEELWFERTHTGQHRTSPLLVDGRLYFASNDGWVSVVNAGRTFDLVGSFEVGEAITASLIVADGVLYVRSSDALYAVRSGL
ncbi:MAG: pyrrolo-quinoline quinone [Planctomycetota bacterium]|nr:MAG: pyrrolo-quinoline quinone [Planctomycetota bacterium]